MPPFQHHGQELLGNPKAEPVLLRFDDCQMSVPHTVLQASKFLDRCLSVGFGETGTRSVRLGETDVPTHIWGKIFYWIYGEHRIARPDTKDEANIMGEVIDFLLPREDTDEGKALGECQRYLSELNWSIVQETTLPVDVDLPHGILALCGTEFTVSGLVLASISTIWDKQLPVRLPATVSISALEEIMRIAHRSSSPASHATSADLYEIIQFIQPPDNTEIGRILLGMQLSHETLQKLPELYKDHPDIVTQEMLELLGRVNKKDIRGVGGISSRSPKDYALLWGNRDWGTRDIALLPRGMLGFIESLPDSSDGSALLFFGVICQVIFNSRNSWDPVKPLLDCGCHAVFLLHQPKEKQDLNQFRSTIYTLRKAFHDLSSEKQYDGRPHFLYPAEGLCDSLCEMEKSLWAGQTKLCKAAMTSNLEDVRALLDAGADVDEPNSMGRTPLSVASEGDNFTTVQALLHAGAEVDSQDPEGRTPFWYACRNGRCHDVMGLLLDAGSNPSLESGDRRTPLSWVGQKMLERSQQCIARYNEL